jgi:hypothetical protein
MRETLGHWFDAPLMKVSARISALRGAPPALAIAGLVAGLLALPIIARQYYAIGFVIFLLGQAINALARATRDDRFGDDDRGRWAFVVDGLTLPAVPFAFALADPGRALASSFLLFGFVVAAAASSAERGARPMDRAACILAYAPACIFPERFGLIAYVLGTACFASAGIRLAGSRT